jgi:molybdopterin-guanine dinucleotide biosynthesis protein A
MVPAGGEYDLVVGTGAVLLLGGRSTRMGRPKASLDWHGQALATRVAAILRRAVEGGPVVAVHAPGQLLPPLLDGVVPVADDVAGEGPLRGIAVGLRALAADVDRAYVSAVDVPLLHPLVVARVLSALAAGVDVAVPVAHGHRHPLAAAYRTALAPLAAELLGAGERKIGTLFDRCRVSFLEPPWLQAEPRVAAADPQLDSFRNLNTPADYEAARTEPLPAVAVEVFGALRRQATAAYLELEALTVGAAVAAAGLALDGHVVVAVNGGQVIADPEYPLAAGDRLALIAADAGG